MANAVNELITATNAALALPLLGLSEDAPAAGIMLINDASGLRLDGKELDARELAAILAGLRSLANCVIADDESDMTSEEIGDVATEGGTFEALNVEEIDALCERINR